MLPYGMGAKKKGGGIAQIHRRHRVFAYAEKIQYRVGKAICFFRLRRITLRHITVEYLVGTLTRKCLAVSVRGMHAVCDRRAFAAAL